MNYENWLDAIEAIRKGKNVSDTLKKLQESEINANINNLLIPKLIELINDKFTITTDKIIDNIESIFNDINYLDLMLVTYKKDLKLIVNLIKLKQLPFNIQTKTLNSIKEKADQTYDILINKANQIDQTGTFSITIKNNMINWSEI